MEINPYGLRIPGCSLCLQERQEICIILFLCYQSFKIEVLFSPCLVLSASRWKTLPGFLLHLCWVVAPAFPAACERLCVHRILQRNNHWEARDGGMSWAWWGLGVMELHHFRGFSACVLLKAALKDGQCPNLGWVEQDCHPRDPSLLEPAQRGLIPGLEHLSCEESWENGGSYSWKCHIPYNNGSHQVFPDFLRKLWSKGQERKHAWGCWVCCMESIH